MLQLKDRDHATTMVLGRTVHSNSSSPNNNKSTANISHTGTVVNNSLMQCNTVNRRATTFDGEEHVRWVGIGPTTVASLRSNLALGHERTLTPVRRHMPLARLASMVAPPRFPLQRLHGVFAAGHALASPWKLRTRRTRFASASRHAEVTELAERNMQNPSIGLPPHESLSVAGDGARL